MYIYICTCIIVCMYVMYVVSVCKKLIVLLILYIKSRFVGVLNQDVGSIPPLSKHVSCHA